MSSSKGEKKRNSTYDFEGTFDHSTLEKDGLLDKGQNDGGGYSTQTLLTMQSLKIRELELEVKRLNDMKDFKVHSLEQEVERLNGENRSQKAALARFTTCYIDQLPHQLLVERIFHALPWRDRVRGVEGVCRSWRQLMLAHGWTDVKHFSTYDNEMVNRLEDHVSNLSRWRRNCHLLTRIGPHLKSLSICGHNELHRSRVDELRAQLAKCPQLNKLSLNDELDPLTIEQIQGSYAGSLTSLELLYPFPRTSPQPTVEALNRALREFPHLEALKIRDYLGEGAGVLLHTPSLSRLCKLSLDLDEATATFYANNRHVFASLPALRSLSLGQVQAPIPFFSQPLPLLSHLAVVIGRSNVDAFVSALPHFATNLKAIDVGIKGDYGDGNEQLVLVNRIANAVASGLPQLEHLDMWLSSIPLLRDVVGGLAPLGQMKKLRSFRLYSPGQSPDGEWAWLEGMSRLEYFAMTPAPPISVTCALIKSCKNLRVIHYSGWDGYTPSAADFKAMIEAASSSTSVEANSGEGGGQNSLPKLYVLIASDLLDDDLQCTWIHGDGEEAKTTPSRLSFVDNREFYKLLPADIRKYYSK